MSAAHCWVFGGASGLGFATARLLADQGFSGVVFDRQESVADKGAELGWLSAVVDVTDAGAMENTLEEFAGQQLPSAVVNCVGVAPAKRILGRNGPCPIEDFEQVVKINLIGAFNVLRLGAFYMNQRSEELEEKGVIIQTSSIAAGEGQLGQAAYSASKAGVVGMTLPAARELAARKIRVMTISPGLMATPMLLGMPDEVQDNLKSQTVLPKRFGQPDEFAMMVKHIIDNPMLNGENIRFDGAMRMV